MFWSYPEVALHNVRDSYDYIIVGGGTAGCVIANRLSRDPDVSVLVLERGPISNNWVSRVPLFSQHHASDGARSRVWKSTPQKHVDNREIELVTGSALGGGTRVNSMFYSRGLPAEYNSWAEEGREGWSYNEMQRYFMRSENDLDQDPNNPQDFHGVSGEWKNRSFKQPYWNHTKDVVKACTSLGVPYVDDINSPLHPSHGCAKLHYNIDNQGRRCSTFSAFLPASLVKERKEHLHICTCVAVARLELTKNGNGDSTAEGVWVQANKEGSVPRLVYAKREVILSAGPIASPQILMLSGIGPKEHLKEHGIEVVKDLPGVGSHLQDHLSVAVQYCIPREGSLNDLQLRPWTIIKQFFLYLFFGVGVFLGYALELSIFIQSRLLTPDMRVVTPSTTDVDAGRPENLPDVELMALAASPKALLIRKGGFSFLSALLRPNSTGTVRLASTNPLAAPLIDPNYFSSHSDLVLMRQAVRFAHKIKEQMVSSGYPITDLPTHPALDDDAATDSFIRSECMSSLHYSSTCRMAPEAAPSLGVVDDRLRVHGVHGLRVADSSIYPRILATHLAAPTVAVGEKCADMVDSDWGYGNRKKGKGSLESVTANGHL